MYVPRQRDEWVGWSLSLFVIPALWLHSLIEKPEDRSHMIPLHEYREAPYPDDERHVFLYCDYCQEDTWHLSITWQPKGNKTFECSSCEQVSE